MVDTKEISMRCDCRAEVVTFMRHDWNHNDTSYEITIEDAYCGGDYMGIKGRFKRAWRAFRAKPIYYSGVYCQDGSIMKKFLENCLSLMNEEVVKDEV